MISKYLSRRDARMAQGRCFRCGVKKESENLAMLNCERCRVKARDRARKLQGWKGRENERDRMPFDSSKCFVVRIDL